MLKVYAYKGCSTCRNAMKWLRDKGVTFEELAIRETPPSIAELQAMLEARGEVRSLFNTSGQDYRALGIKDKLPGMTQAEILKLLNGNGNLIKRPFVIDESQQVYLTGFKEAEWEQSL